MFVIAVFVLLIVFSVRFLLKLPGKIEPRVVLSGMLVIAGFVALVLFLIVQPTLSGSADPEGGERNLAPRPPRTQAVYTHNIERPAP